MFGKPLPKTKAALRRFIIRETNKFIAKGGRVVVCPAPKYRGGLQLKVASIHAN